MSGMAAYNGFPGALRSKAQRWLNAEWASGRLARPVECCACGQVEGPIDAHAEDYSEPFQAGKTDEFHLCYCCHLACHCRFRDPGAWDAYRKMVRLGGRMVAAGRNFPRFILYFKRAQWGTPAIPEIYNWQRAEQNVLEHPLDVIDGWLKAHTGKGWR